ncbi:hypothetical protein H257_03138 [Aphanomyces astaci]|uniref:Uncharacterized protein n=1 Tax=Aphanomyces astaci TaxID=112090 RepID=W4H1B6_APHAT|nr:hypothetical protein H257_03138 [Aphanomyces astaci]ETV85381.1 hypothetical protein H257_03138 [Aphanomyces astaci]|eukprot:XP_009825399.1 hypothetical protein H257_03138 [Aphanomyces astaci]
MRQAVFLVESGDDDDDDAADAVMPKLDFIKCTTSTKHQGECGDASQPLTHPMDGTPLLVRPAIPRHRPQVACPRLPAAAATTTHEQEGDVEAATGPSQNATITPPGPRLPRVNELEEQPIAHLEPNSVSMKLTVRGRLKSQRVSITDTPTAPLPSHQARVPHGRARVSGSVLRHLLVESNGRDTAMMSVKTTVALVKTCTKTALLKFKQGLGISVSRVSAGKSVFTRAFWGFYTCYEKWGNYECFLNNNFMEWGDLRV